MAWKYGLILLATFLPILVQPISTEAGVAPQVLARPAIPRLSLVPQLDDPRPQATFAIATFAPPTPLTASATFKLAPSFPLATPRVSLRAVDSPECYYPDVSEFSIFAGVERL